MKNFSLLSKLGVLLTFVCISYEASAQIYLQEDFNAGWPATWSTINGDASTNNANVQAAFGTTSGWVVIEDYDTVAATLVIDSVAASTSWFDVVAPADDWLITPQVTLGPNSQITYEEKAQDPAYPDGYELRVSTTTPTPASFMANPALYTVAAAANPTVQQTFSLSAYANQSVYIAWHNNSTDQFVLMIDNVLIDEVATAGFDVSMSDTTTKEYTIVPLSQVSPMGANGLITEVGGSAVTGATMTVNVYDGTMTNVYSASSTPTNLGVGASTAASVAGYTPTLADVYTVELIASINEADVSALNDTVSYTVVISDSVYARDDSQVVGSLGIGAGNGGQMGQQFELIQGDDMTSASFFITNTSGNLVGQAMVVTVYDMVGGIPNAVVAQTDTLIIVDAVDSLYTIPMYGGPATFAAGTYMVALNEPDSTLSLGYTASIYTAGATWINWPTNPFGGWSNNEDFGFPNTYVLRPNFAATCAGTTSSITESSCGDYTAPSGAVLTATGVYTDVIPNAAGCDSTITIDLTVTVLDLTVTAADPTITANMAGATYQWIDCDNGNQAINGETNQAYTATATGNYAVIVTMNGCSDTSSCSNIVVGLNELDLSSNLEIYPNPTSGEFTVFVDGITASEVTIELADLSGKVITTETYANVVDKLNVPMNVNVDAGVYFIQISADGIRAVKRIVISKK